ncbi:ectoine hydroxylase [Marinobacter fonticola]|uniref:ectoine hydroxylase n=1 Tax=Marinobacter fonticola TaxID=2603215 RepID=UPI0011E8333B|nr:ectoine hydroxylase [Marinobacter fonticola]
MLQTADHYPTRLDDKLGTFDRREPVVHSTGKAREHGPLGVSQLDQFERDGFIWLESFFPQEVVEPFFEELDAMARDPQMRDREEVIMDAEREKIRSVFAMHELSEAFDRMTRDPRLLGMAQQLLGGDVYIHQSRINSKAGFCGGGFDWHSDFETWHSEDGMPKMRAVSASIMLTDNNAFNGPLMLIPGSHRRFVPCVGKTPDNNWLKSLKSQEIGVPDRDDIASLANSRGIEAPTGPAGSLLLFDCNTLHASNANLSPWPRANLFFVYNSVENRLAEPFAGTQPRPEYLGARKRNVALSANT